MTTPSKNQGSDKPPSEKGMIRLLKQRGVEISPLTFTKVTEEFSLPNFAVDAVVDVAWERESFRFAVECKALNTPKVVRAAVDAALRAAKELGGGNVYPMIFLPFLPPDQLEVIRKSSVSAIDLCGNVLIQVPGRVYVERTGKPNRFPRSGAIKNVYRQSSSIVARLFLLEPYSPSVIAAWEALRKRGAAVNVATVSKVCQQLDEDLIIERKYDAKTGTRALRLLQADKLMAALASNYRPPEISGTFTGRWTRNREEMWPIMTSWVSKDRRLVLSGESSTPTYAVFAVEPVVSVYCTDIEELRKKLGTGLQEDDRFPMLRLLETRDEFVYFDAREFVASPVQSYLELMNGDKRQRDTAEQLRTVIQENLQR